jgi:hypothetical protein
VLIVALILATLFSALAWSLVTTTEIAVRSQGATLLLSRAERAAQSGIEWAAADIARNGERSATTVVPIATGTSATVTITPGASPNVSSRGVADRVSLTLVANVAARRQPFPYTVASFGGSSALQRPLISDGPVYFANSGNPINLQQSRKPSQGPALILRGDLDLVTTVPLPDGMVNHQNSGKTNLGVPSMAKPIVDTTSFLTMTGGAVPVHHYTGTTTLRNVDLVGIVVIRQGSSDSILIQNSTIRGTLVVHPTYTPGNDTATPIDLRGNVSIVGGTARTGNLAVLAPDGALKSEFGSSIDLRGVVYSAGLNDATATQVTGMLLTNKISTLADLPVVVPSGWVEDLRLGLTLPSPRGSVGIEWLGRP